MAGAGKRRNRANRGGHGLEASEHAPPPPAAPAPAPEQAPQSEPEPLAAVPEPSAAVTQPSVTGTEISSETARSTSAGEPVSAEPLAISTFDGNRDPGAPTSPTSPTSPTALMNKNIDFPVTVWAHNTDTPIEIQKRPATSKIGREAPMGLNTFHVTSFPKAPVYQYDVLIGNGSEKKAVVMKVWESKTTASKVPNIDRWIFDRSKIAWSTAQLTTSLRYVVDLDAEEGRTAPTDPAKADKNKFKVSIRPTATNAVIRFDQLDAYLVGKADFGVGCMEAINFLDHLIREWPSRQLTQIKRNFYPKQGIRVQLGSGAEAMKGTYASVRIGHSPNGTHTLTVNVDVANGTFWSQGAFINLCAAVLGLRDPRDLPNRIRNSAAQTELRRKLRHVRLEATHRGNGIVDTYCFAGFYHQTATQYRMKNADQTNGPSIAEYFKTKYKINVRNDLPLVQMTKKGTLLPLELLSLAGNQRVNGKLDERQTSEMIKFAVTPPPQRWQDIQKGLQNLNWKSDKFLTGYGLRISEQNATTMARIMPNPAVQFAGTGDASFNNPSTTGRWRIDGKKFLKVNSQPLKSWGVCIIPGRYSVQKPDVERFLAQFVQIYRKHGGVVDAEKKPVIHVPSNAMNPADAVAETYNLVKKASGLVPQILMFVLPDKNVQTYGRIKKSCECRFGVMSQCMQSSHVQKAQGQYISNVCMKFNAKLGGITARATKVEDSKGRKVPPIGRLPPSCMIVAADVTHPPPASQGSDEARFSVAAIVQSQDPLHTRYTAMVESNGFRQEIIQTANWEKAWKPQLMNWVTTLGQGRLPATILYFRDGVSEGQFAAVVRNEVRDMRDIVKRIDSKAQVKFVVIIATKRHHIRFFPPQGNASVGDKKGNPLPGTLVESCVTHPFENDFFLCSHVALKGTARPVHYHVLVNEANIPNELIQTMIYEHCYQFMRASTPVSLHPAVYYADICALRGRYHDKFFGVSTASSGDSKPGSGSQSGGTSSSDIPVDVPPLMPFGKDPGLQTSTINHGMWYI